MTDRRALRILFSTFWSAEGWRRAYSVDPTDLAYAISKGLMFTPEDERELTHAAVVRRVLAARSATNPERASRAFLASLSSRELSLRSALASYAFARQFPDHQMMPWTDSHVCAICGYRGGNNDRNVLNFERHKWGGVRHLDPYYVAFDLEQFSLLDVPDPCDEDRMLLKRVLGTARGLPQTKRVGDLMRALAGIIPSNRNERRVLIEILCSCGILATPEHPGFASDWIPFSVRFAPPGHTNDWEYPAYWWRGGGVSDESIALWFPDLLSG